MRNTKNILFKNSLNLDKAFLKINNNVDIYRDWDEA